MCAGHLSTGRSGEDIAALFLLQKGWTILGRNVRFADGELDLVAQDKDTLVFVEVKTRSTDARGEPGQAVGRAKQMRLIRAASRYLSAHKAWDRPCRFDVISIVIRNKEPEITHWEDSIDVGHTMGRRHSAWQPW